MKIRDQSWFEMREFRSRSLANAVWIPLRAIQTFESSGEFGSAGHFLDFFGAGSLMVPTTYTPQPGQLGWSEIGIANEHSGRCEDGVYEPADTYDGWRNDIRGIHLVLEQRRIGPGVREWHLHQDFVITLGLIREGDRWLRPAEGYLEVARLNRDNDGDPALLEVRAFHLRDYLCARGCNLYVTSYRDRIATVEDLPSFTWASELVTEENETDKWEGRTTAIHDGSGSPFGTKVAVFHVSRTDINPHEDVPIIAGPPTDSNTTGESWETQHAGRKIYRIQGELWRNESIRPASASPLVRGDKIPSTASFIVDASGSKLTGDALDNDGRWLWFLPQVVPTLANRRGGHLSWYTCFTGRVGALEEHAVTFGINELGLINVYAKDIGYLSEWHQKVWAGFNVGPDGKVSEELFASQARGLPVDTQAPEAFLAKARQELAAAVSAKWGIDLFRGHADIPSLLLAAHRFRACDKAGLFALAKDLARLLADDINASALHAFIQIPEGQKAPGSLKSLQNVLSHCVGEDTAKGMMSPLFNVYDIRHGDSHLPKSDIDQHFANLSICETDPFVHQGLQLLSAIVAVLYEIADAIGASVKKAANQG